LGTSSAGEARTAVTEWRRLQSGPGHSRYAPIRQASDHTFPRITAHDLRHTAASLAISAGGNVKVVQRMLGHTSAAMTLDVYADLFDTDLEVVADRLEDVLNLCSRSAQ
jgi:integrase